MSTINIKVYGSTGNIENIDGGSLWIAYKGALNRLNNGVTQNIEAGEVAYIYTPYYEPLVMFTRTANGSIYFLHHANTGWSYNNVKKEYTLVCETKEIANVTFSHSGTTTPTVL